MDELNGFPESFATRPDGALDLHCDARIYPLETIFSASYTLLDKAYFQVDRLSDGAHSVRVAAKDGGSLRGVAGAFANELLAAACRRNVHARKEVILESVTLAAMAGALGRPDLDDLDDFDFSEGGLDDPLGIATSWEEKYKKADPAAPSDEETPT